MLRVAEYGKPLVNAGTKSPVRDVTHRTRAGVSAGQRCRQPSLVHAPVAVFRAVHEDHGYPVPVLTSQLVVGVDVHDPIRRTLFAADPADRGDRGLARVAASTHHDSHFVGHAPTVARGSCVANLTAVMTPDERRLSEVRAENFPAGLPTMQ